MPKISGLMFENSSANCPYFGVQFSIPSFLAPLDETVQKETGLLFIFRIG